MERQRKIWGAILMTIGVIWLLWTAFSSRPAPSPVMVAGMSPDSHPPQSAPLSTSKKFDAARIALNRATNLQISLGLKQKLDRDPQGANVQTSPEELSNLPVPPYASAAAFQLFEQSYFDLFRDHNQMLDAYHELIVDQKIQPNHPRTLFHIDYHSDLYRNNRQAEDHFEGIGNYVNTLVADGDVDEVWWLVPDSTESSQQTRFFWQRPKAYVDWQFRDGPADQTICVNAKGYFTFGDAQMACAGRRVPFHKRSLRMLEGKAQGKPYEAIVPAGLFAGREVLLDIDADFFDFNGLYANDSWGPSPRLYSLFYEPPRLNQEFNRVLKALDRVSIRPILTTCAMSPQYTNSNAPKIEVFFRYIAAYSRTGTDYLLRYTHSIQIQDSFPGFSRNRLRGLDAQIYYDLMSADRMLGRRDRLDFQDTDRVNLARTLIQRHTQWPPETIAEKLQKIAQNQHHPNYIDLAALSGFDDLRR